MGAKSLTPLSNFKKIKLVWFAIFIPAKFEAEEKKDGILLDAAPTISPTRVSVVRRSYFESFFHVLSAVFAGCLVAFFSQTVGLQSKFWVPALAVFGTSLLLWATVAVKGWEIGSFYTATLGERLNVWVFRVLYWVGTACLVAAATWQTAIS
jgi:hypothetical protein